MGKFVLAAVSVLMLSGAQAAVFDVSPDTAIELGGATIQRQDVARGDLSGGAPGSLADLGSLPDGADVVGYHEATPAQQLFVLDVNADLGGTYASAGDVIAYDPGTGVYQIGLDMSALGIPDGTRVDAFGLTSNGDYILSFDVTVDLGGGLVASDEDLISYSSGGGFTMLLNGSNVGLDRSLDLDAASELDGNLLVSFDGHGSIGGIDFADEDVLSFDSVASTWTHVYDGSAVHPGQWAGADLVAVPEPGAWSLMGAGMALLAGLARRKRKLALIAALLVPASVGMASDGVLEINQACAVNTGCFSGDAAGFPVTINSVTGAAGHSFRLTGDLNVDQSTTAIQVLTANNVSIDLNGFSIVGPVTCSGSPVACSPPGSGNGVQSIDSIGVSGKNGSITGMGGWGVILGERSEITNLRANNNRQHGISVAARSTVSGNVANRNGAGGIFAGDGSTVLGNTVSDNGSTGIHVGNGSTVLGNTSERNDDSGIYSFSVIVGSSLGGSTISDNTASGNGGSGIIDGACCSTISGNTANGNGSSGISAYSGSSVKGNTTASNTGHGIQATSGTTVLENNASGNTSTGIWLTGDGNTVKDNTASTNGARGISTGSGSTLVGNTAYSNTLEGIRVGGYGSTIKNNSTRSNGSDGITVAGNGSNIRDNTSRDNSGYGLNISGSTESGYGGNVFSNNSSGHVNGGTQLGENLCGGSICP